MRKRSWLFEQRAGTDKCEFRFSRSVYRLTRMSMAVHPKNPGKPRLNQGFRNTLARSA